MLIAVVPTPADFLKTATVRFVKVPGEPRGESCASLPASHVPELLIDPPVPSRTPPVPVHVVVPNVLRTLPPVTSFTEAPPIAAPPFALTVPAPVIVPPLQVIRPETLIVSPPWMLPPDIVSVAGATVSPLPNETVPPPIVSAVPMEVSVAEELNVTDGPLPIVVSDVTAYEPSIVIVPL